MREPTLDEIIVARDECARIIARFGDQYLPIFERLENEIEKREKDGALFRRALKIATQNATQSATQIRIPFNSHLK
ncbi:MAG: hypothetical protein AAGA64_12320 [Bacteroidota bacterium]